MSSTTREEIRIGPLAVRFVLEGDDADGSVALFEFDVSAQARVPAGHSHDGYEETIYGIQGVLTWTVAGTSVDIGPGEALFIPRGVVHRFDNNGDVDARGLAIVTPGAPSPDYFRDVAAVVQSAAGGPPDLAELGAVMRRHGLTPAP